MRPRHKQVISVDNINHLHINFMNIPIETKQMEVNAISPHRILYKLGLLDDPGLEKVQMIFTKEIKVLGYPERLTVTDQGELLTNVPAWRAMKENGVHECQVDVLSGLQDNEVL